MHAEVLPEPTDPDDRHPRLGPNSDRCVKRRVLLTKSHDVEQRSAAPAMERRHGGVARGVPYRESLTQQGDRVSGRAWVNLFDHAWMQVSPACALMRRQQRALVGETP